MCVGGGGGARPLFTPTPLTPVAPPPPPDQIDLMGVPQMALQSMLNRQSSADTAAKQRRKGKMGGKQMMTIPKRTY